MKTDIQGFIGSVAGRLFLGVIALLATLTFPAFCRAQDYPSRSVRLIVPFAAGGAGDVTPRLVANEMKQTLGEPIIVENRPGAGGNVGAAYVATTPADGYTMLVTTPGILMLSNLQGVSKLTYNDFAPIGLMFTTPMTMSALSSSPFKSLGELITYAKANPGKLTYAHNGPGSIAELSAALLMQTTGISMVGVPYSGDAQAIPDFLAGRVDISQSSNNALAAQIKAGTVRVLAVFGDSRLPNLPNVPTTAEAGYPDVTAGAWVGLDAPQGTPEPYRERLNAALKAALQVAEVRNLFLTQGFQPVTESVGWYTNFRKQEFEKWRKVIANMPPRAK
jgi:tripartite-type tricarboxylate transporter receptor subunit TctC